MSKDLKRLLKTHPNLIHTDAIKVVSHVQRQQDDWYLNTLMLEGVDVPFKYRRKQAYKNLRGARVNVTYYPQTESVAGLAFDYMKVVRLKVS